MNKRGELEKDMFGGWIIGLIALGIVVAVVIVGGIMVSGGNLSKIFEKYAPPKLNFSNSYGFTAEKLRIEDPLPSGCHKTATDNSYTCTNKDKITFSSEVYNNGHKQNTFNGGIVVCTSPSKDDTACGSKQLTATSQDRCTLTIGETKWCSAGVLSLQSYTVGKTYEVHPAVECIGDIAEGCGTIKGETVKSYNSNNWITITITS